MCFKIFFKPTFLVNCVVTCKFELNKLSTIIGYLLAHLLTLRVFFLCSWAEGSCINFFFFLIKFPISLECMLGFGEYEDCLCAIGWRRICSGRTGSCSTPTEHWTLYTCAGATRDEYSQKYNVKNILDKLLDRTGLQRTVWPEPGFYPADSYPVVTGQKSSYIRKFENNT